jgi:hypothetical protein
LIFRAVRLATIFVVAAILLLAALSLVWPGAARAADGTCGEASAGGSTSWYFAEGYTGEGFQEYVTLFNPGDAFAHLKVYMLFGSIGFAPQPVADSPGGAGLESGPPRYPLHEAASPGVFELDLPPRSRTTLDINSLAGRDREVSLHLESSLPVVAERPMYFTYRGAWKGCTVTSGADSLSKKWYFAEGCTRQGFEEWLLLANPGDTGTSALIHMFLEDGSTRMIGMVIPARSRGTIFINQVAGEGRDVSIRVDSTSPICAERVMYFDYQGKWQGGHASSGLSRPRKAYLFAEGYTGAGFEEWLTLYKPLQPGEDDGTDVTLNCLFRGGEERSFQVHLEPDRRYTLNINQLVGEGKDVSLELSAGEPFLAERPMYFNYRGVCRGGHVSSGVEAAGDHWYLAEGTTRGGFHTYLCLMNPNRTDAEVEIDSIFGTETLTDARTIPARSRMTIEVAGPLKYMTPAGRVNAAAGSEDVSFEIRSDLPVAVERPVYHPGTSFEVANAMDHIWHLSVNIGQRIEGTAGEAGAAEYIAGALRSYGYAPEIQEVPLPNGSVTRNVIAEYTPLVSPDSIRTLFVGGHYDTKIGTGSPGANDNASGTAVVLELARCFAEEPPVRGVAVRFILFGGEERLVDGTDLHHFGSRYYVKHLSEWERERAIGAIVLDMVGVGSQLYARTMGVGPMDLCNHIMAYARGAGIYLPYLLGGSYSDHEPFENAGIPAVWLEYMTDPWYHTPQDSFDKINQAYIENTGRLVEGFIRSL